MKKKTLVLIILSLIVIIINGCDKDDDDIFVDEGLPTYRPVGTITGLITDACTGEPIKGAVFSLSYNGKVHSLHSDVSGQFSFYNVPAGKFEVIGGSTVATGIYTITASLVNYNKSTADTTKHYRNYYYKTATVTFTSLVPGDSLGVSGLVGNVVFEISQLNSTIVGQVVDENMQGVSSANVILFDQSITPGIILKQTQTDTAGNYRFTNIDNGIIASIQARSADGQYEGSLPGTLTIPCNYTYDSLRSYVSTERIQLHCANDVEPYVIDINPPNNSDVSPEDLEIVYTFSAPIKQTAYTRTDLGYGHGTIIDDITVSYVGLKKSAGEIKSGITWNETMNQLKIRPISIVGSAKYNINVASALPKLHDESNLSVIDNTNIIGDFEGLSFTTSGQSPIPEAPVLTRRIITGVYDHLDYDGGLVSLEWNEDQNARSYNLYRQIGEGSFELVSSDIYNLITTHSTGMLVTPTVNDPLAALTVKYQVRALSHDLVEGQESNTITIRDNISPRLISTNTTSISSQRFLMNFRFSEPLKISSAENLENYTIHDPDTVVFAKEQAAYLGYDNGSDSYEVLFTVTISNGSNFPAGFSVRIGSELVDLAGNSINESWNTYVYSAPPVPILLSPDDDVSDLLPTSNLIWQAANGATSYRLLISNNAAFTSLVHNKDDISSTSYNLSEVTGLVSGTKYYWKVQAVNSAGSSSFSSVRSFTLQ